MRNRDGHRNQNGGGSGVEDEHAQSACNRHDPKEQWAETSFAADDRMKSQAAGEAVFAQRLRQKEAAQNQEYDRRAERLERAARFIDAQRNLHDRHQQRNDRQWRRFQRQNQAGEDEKRQRLVPGRAQTGGCRQEQDDDGQAQNE